MNRALKMKINDKVKAANVQIRNANSLNDEEEQIELLKEAYSGVAGIVPNDASLSEKKEIWSYINERLEEPDVLNRGQ